MKILLDNNVNFRFGRLLFGHDVTHVQDIGWEKLQNGKLLTQAESENFPILVTADKQMQHQQNMTGRTISIIILGSRKITLAGIVPLAPQVLDILNSGVSPGSIIIAFPVHGQDKL